MKSRKFIVLLLCVAMVCTSGSFAFAAEALETQAPAEPALAEENAGIQEESATVEQAGEEESMLAEEISEDAVLETAGERVAGNIVVHYPPSLSAEKDTTVTVEYTDDFFNTDNSKYNKKIAKFLLAASMAGYSYPVLLDSADGITRDKNIKALLIDDLKYTGYKSFKYDVTVKNSDDTAGYAFAYKEIGEEKVMAVVLRSYGYGAEWVSNLKVTGSGTAEHQGFANTATAMYKDVAAYAKANGITKIWMTGYSRGAAVANVLAKRISDNKLVSAADLYCYTFETPATTKSGTSVQGLYNVINSADSIPQIPFYNWGYQRYGQDEFYIVNKVSIKNYNKGMSSKNLANLRKKITYSVPTNNSLDISLGCIAAVLGGNEAGFASKYEQKLQSLGGNLLGGSDEAFAARTQDSSESIVLAMTLLGLQPYLDANGVNGTAIFAQHTPEALLFWMDTINPSQSFEYKYITLSNSYKKCNILIKDSKGKKVAEINKGNYSRFIKKNSKYSLEVCKDENGNLKILVPTDDKYTFKLTATVATKIDYTVTDYSCSVKTGIAEYKGIKLKKKGTITAKASNNYAAKVSKGKVGSKSKYSGSEVAVASVNASVSGGSNLMDLQTSFVTGTGKYPDHYEVTLNVHNSDPTNYVLDGWYLDGNKISSTAKCTVTTDASKAMDLVVKFKEKN